MSREAIIEYLGRDWCRMEALIRDYLYSDVELLSQVNDHVVSNAGKMLRPMLAMLMAKACGTVTDDTVRFAAASEMLHNATLIHDDVADESAMRRGSPTLNSKIGPRSAVLVGDFWLAKAMDVVLSTSRYEEVIGYFSKTLVNLAEGEMLQLQKAGSGDTTEQDYFKIIYSKTASLFEAAVMAGAVSVGAGDEYREISRRYALEVGLAFQIKDDILDYAGDVKVGKPLGMDLKEQKITLPLLGAMTGSMREKEIRRKVTDIKRHPEYIEEISEFVRDNGGIEYAAGKLREHIDAAVSALGMLPENKAKGFLIQLAEYNNFRDQ